MKGKWPAGIPPRNFTWVMKDHLAMSERPGGYAPNHRKVRRREEIIWRETTNANLRMYTTTDVTKRRIYTLMHDPTYRAQVNFEQASYNQPPHPGFRISPNMDAQPVPSIFVK